GYSATGGAVGWLSAGSVPAGLLPTCAVNEMERALEAGGQYWDHHTVGASPVKFPRGTFSEYSVRNPLGNLGPSGNPTNISPTGPAGSWCRPPPTPFYQTSPLEDPLTWIVFGLLAGGILVFYLSRGVSLPT